MQPTASWCDLTARRNGDITVLPCGASLIRNTSPSVLPAAAMHMERKALPWTCKGVFRSILDKLICVLFGNWTFCLANTNPALYWEVPLCSRPCLTPQWLGGNVHCLAITRADFRRACALLSLMNSRGSRARSTLDCDVRMGVQMIMWPPVT